MRGIVGIDEWILIHEVGIMCIALEERTVSKMARYAVEHIWEGKKEYFLIRDHQSWQMVLLPSKYLTHLIRANRSPNTVGRRAKSIRFYLEYLNETKLELSQVAEQEFQEQYEHYVGFLHWLKAGNH